MKKMKKSIFILFAFAGSISFAISQTVEDGIKLLYYGIGRNKSAKETLKKVVDANPKNAYDIYWYGQALLSDNNDPNAVANAKALYQKALTDGVNEPWIWVGMGHVQLLEANADVNSAKQKFEQAITATKGKKGVENADILNAVGRANADGSSTQGDPLYGIDVLKRAQAIDLKNPDIDINLGTCYLKLGTEKGGEAVEAFRDATMRNPQYAAAYYKMGRVYQAQTNKTSMDEQYQKAITADPSYAPVYLAYFIYYEEKDVNLAKENLDKYIANSDKDCNTDYLLADYLFRAGKYQESLNKANEMSNGDCKDFVRINVLYAYDYDRLGDSLKAKDYITKFFATAPQSKIEPADYVFAGKLLAKFPGSSNEAIQYLTKAADMDTIMVNRVNYMNIMADVYGKDSMVEMQIRTMLKAIAMKGKASEGDYYKLSKAATDALTPSLDSVKLMSLYALADSITKAYIAVYPDKPQPYSFNVLAGKKSDRDTSKGLAIAPMMKYNEFLIKDTAKNKKTIFNNYYYMLIYYHDHAHDLQKSIEMCDAMIALYPDPMDDNNKSVMSIKDVLTKELQRGQQKNS